VRKLARLVSVATTDRDQIQLLGVNQARSEGTGGDRAATNYAKSHGGIPQMGLGIRRPMWKVMSVDGIAFLGLLTSRD